MTGRSPRDSPEFPGAQSARADSASTASPEPEPEPGPEPDPGSIYVDVFGVKVFATDSIEVALGETVERDLLIVAIEGLERTPELRLTSIELFGGFPHLRRSFGHDFELGPGDRFELDAPPPGRYHVRLVLPESMPETAARLVVPDGAETVHLTLAIPREEAFLGRCLDARGAPIEPGQFAFTDGSSLHLDPAELGPDGRFAHSELRPGPTIAYLFLGDGEERCDLGLGPITVDSTGGRDATFRVGGTATLLIELEGVPEGDPDRELFVNLLPVEYRQDPHGSRPPDPARSTSAGTIHVPHIRATVRTKRTSAIAPYLTPGRFRAAVRWGDATLLDETIEVRPGETTLRVPYRAPTPR